MNARNFVCKKMHFDVLMMKIVKIKFMTKILIFQIVIEDKYLNINGIVK